MNNLLKYFHLIYTHRATKHNYRVLVNE